MSLGSVLSPFLCNLNPMMISFSHLVLNNISILFMTLQFVAPELQLSVSTWVFNRHHKLNMLKKELLNSPQKLFY